MRELTCQRKENIVFQTQSLIGKVRDVADAFIQTVLRLETQQVKT